MLTCKEAAELGPIELRSGIFQIGKSLVLPYDIMGGRLYPEGRSILWANLHIKRSAAWSDVSLRGLYEDLYLGIDPALPLSVQGADRRAQRFWRSRENLPAGRIPIVLSCLQGNKTTTEDEVSLESLGAEAIFVLYYTTLEPAGTVRELAYGLRIRLYDANDLSDS